MGISRQLFHTFQGRALPSRSQIIERGCGFSPCLPCIQASFPSPSPTQAHSEVTEGPGVKVEEQMLVEQVEEGPTAISSSHLLHQQLGRHEHIHIHGPTGDLKETELAEMAGSVSLLSQPLSFQFCQQQA